MMKGSIMSKTTANNNDAILSRLAELEAQQAELKTLREQAKSMVRLGVSKNGHLAIYGIRKFPITLKTAELPKVSELFTSGKVAEFISANASKLAMPEA